MRPSRFFAMTALSIAALGFVASKSNAVRRLPGIGKLG